MGSRKPRLPLATLLITLAGLACQPGAPSQPPTSATGTAADGFAEEPPAEDPTEAPAEEIAVVDEGPPGLVVLFTAGLKGYTEPCGCTMDLVLGGIDRVTGYLTGFAELVDHTLVLDAGNLLFERETLRDAERAQELRKTRVLVEALQRAGTLATTPGPTDFAAGVEFYRETLAESGMLVLSANLETAEGERLGPPFTVESIGATTVGVVGAASLDGFESVEGLVVAPALQTVVPAAQAARDEGAETVILLWQGDLASARTELRELTDVDFVVIGQPRDTDEVVRVGSAHTLEAYDQGRNVGRLKLVFGEADEWSNARAGSHEEIARLERVIAGIEEQLSGVPDSTEPPPIVLRQRERGAGLAAELEAMRSATVDFSRARTFLFRPIAMEPGLPTNDAITEAMVAYNASLQAINAARAEPPPPAADGMPHYTGVDACAVCHSAAVEFWETTSHADAWSTLVDRDKHWDRSCIGCHTTGYDQPGGSALGHTEGLVNVQCEQCHGPGSLHAASPSVRGAPLGVVRETSTETCVGCHNEEHSTRFDYATYRPRILGPGHGM